MNTEECWRILGVPADAGPEVIRQAYLDLARVWHPDRFQSDEHLRRIAEKHFQDVTRAYTKLKNCRPAPAAAGAARTAATATATAVEEPPGAPPEPAGGPPPAFRQPRRPDSLAPTALGGALGGGAFFP